MLKIKDPATGRFRLLAMAALGGVLFLLLSILIPNKYRVTASVLPSDTLGSNSLSGIASAAATFGLSLPSSGGADDSYVDILQSRMVAEKLLKTRFRFHQRTLLFLPNREKEQTVYEYLDEDTMDEAVKSFQGIVSVSRDFKTKLVTITVDTHSPELSLGIAQTMLDTLDGFLETLGKQMGKSKADQADKELREGEANLRLAEDKFKAFLNAHLNYATTGDPETRIQGSRLEEEYRFRQSLLSQLKANQQQALFEARNQLPTIVVLDRGSLPERKSSPPRMTLVILGMALGAMAGWLGNDWRKVMVWLAGAYGRTPATGQGPSL